MRPRLEGTDNKGRRDQRRQAMKPAHDGGETDDEP